MQDSFLGFIIPVRSQLRAFINTIQQVVFMLVKDGFPGFVTKFSDRQYGICNHTIRTRSVSALIILILSSQMMLASNQPSLKLGLLKYSGGGDWYANPTSLVNLAAFCNKHLNTNFDLEYGVVDVGSAEIFNYAFLHMTGHGNVVFSDADADNLRTYLIAGGFLHIDDNYGMDPFVRVAMKKVFPELEFIELPFSHAIYNQKFSFPNGLPKIHKHDGKPARGYGLFWEGRLICFYSYESDLGDGWEDAEVHNDPEEVRLKALKMGANMIKYVFSM